jgi:hypothetical protein
MTIESLTPVGQDGLRKWAIAECGDELLFDGIGADPQQWAWIVMQLKATEDRPEWFPHGKWGTIQFIEMELLREAWDQVKYTECGRDLFLWMCGSKT